ncbi:YkgJ family cysteine cluster protein [Methanococcoides alaskense]|uniref:Fe-S-cluster containining protein n=1 Tax=Methanococcoides alaskense TaxID=325778 RepID=A0AA90TZ02_9EURY|nr:YkgJ family cysteine cluster protein [Methanococcoides alaskense]MDR6222705.1 Fe-S-cluster containining protein [Methanococcoides alaskense]
MLNKREIKIKSQWLNENKNMLRLTKEINAFFKCPDECDRQCCRGGIPPMMLFEFNDINAIKNKERLSISEKFDKNTIRVVNLGKPCVFLSDGKTCSIYDKRPVSCETYPFALKNDEIKDAHFDYVTLAPCPVGIEIMKSHLTERITLSHVAKLQGHESPELEEQIKRITQQYELMKNIGLGTTENIPKEINYYVFEEQLLMQLLVGLHLKNGNMKRAEEEMKKIGALTRRRDKR